MAVSRNDACPCGSGKKYKRCCMGKAGTVAAAPRAARPAVGHRGLMQTAFRKYRAGQLAGAAMAFQEVLERRPDDPVALAGLGQVRGRLGALDEAIDLLRRAIAAGGNDLEYHLELSSLLLRKGEFESALGSARRALSRDDASAAAQYLVGSCFERMNQIDDAIAAINRALALAPNHGESNVAMARLLRRTGKAAEARERLESAIRRETAPGVRAPMLHELGFVLNKLGAYDAAYEAVAEAGREELKSPFAKRIDRNAQARYVERTLAALTPELLSKWTPADVADDRATPAFLVGFPRSGTTMTEHILAAHPDVTTAEERPFTSAIATALNEIVPGDDPEPVKLAALDRTQIKTLRAAYWAEVESEIGGPPAGRVFLDKLPLNILALGLINVVFPGARVIVALRDPRDVCLSCFMQPFQLNNAMIHFTALDTTVASYARVMRFWLAVRDMLTLPWIEVRYEDTVADLETQARRILDRLDLPWDPRVLAFHEQKSQRFSNTPSFAAVTEKVHTRAVGRWQGYRAHFDPHLPELRPFLDAFGYE